MIEANLRDELLKKIPKYIRESLITQMNESVSKNKNRIRVYEESIKLHSEGLGKRRIARILNLPTSTIESWIYGGSKPNGKIDILPKIITKLKQSGLTNREIGQLLFIHPLTVLQRIKYKKEREDKTFQISEKAEDFIKIRQNMNSFLKYFWLDYSEREIRNFEKYCKLVKLKDRLSPFELSREVGKSYSVAYSWKKGKDVPRLVRWLELFLSVGKPKRNFIWLPINLGSSGIPLRPLIQVPIEIKSWKDVESVILQLKPNDIILPKMTKEECFGFILGMIVGDTSKPKENRDMLALKLSKKYDTNETLGNFFCECLQKLGLKAHRIKDDIGKYRWLSQSSPLLSWIYTVALGLKKHEKTTYDSISATWLFNSPENVQKRFLQGIFESDGSVSFGGTMDCSVYPNSELVKELLAQFGIKSYIILDRKWKKLIINNSDNKKCHDIIFAPEIKTERYKRLERLVNAKRLKKGEKLANDVTDKINEMLKSGAKNYEIIKQVLIKTGYFISPFRIKNYKKINLNH